MGWKVGVYMHHWLGGSMPLEVAKGIRDEIWTWSRKNVKACENEVIIIGGCI